MLDFVKDTITAVPLPPPVTVNDLDWIRDAFASLRADVALLSGLFLALLGTVHVYTRKETNIARKEAAKAIKDYEDRLQKEHSALEEKLKALDVSIPVVIAASERRMAETIMTTVERLARVSGDLEKATIAFSHDLEKVSAEIWRKLDEVAEQRVVVARDQATRADVTALEARMDKRFDDNGRNAREERQQMENRLTALIELTGKRA